MDREPTPTSRVLASGLLTAVWTAVPDHVETRAGQRAVRAALLVAVAGRPAWGLFQSGREIVRMFDGDDEDDVDDDLDDEDEDGDEDDDLEDEDDVGVVDTAGVLLALAGVPLALLAHRSSTRLNHVLVARLAERGVRHPWTCVGLGWGVASVATELVARRLR